MSNTQPFSNLFTSTYYGDAFSELIRLYNLHNHDLTFVKSFLVHPLRTSMPVSFSSNTAIADPFNEIGSNTPLLIERVSANILTLSRAATKSTVGFITYVKDGEYQQIKLVKCTEGAKTLEWDSTTLDAGTVEANVLLKVLQKPYNSYFPLNYLLPSAPGEPPANAITNHVSLELVDQFYRFSGSVGANPKIVLQRGQIYEITLSAELLALGEFRIVRDLVDPAYPLKKWELGVSPLLNSSNVVIGVKFYVPTVAPALLFYQSSISPFRFGEIEIHGGELTTDNAIYAIWQEANPDTIPLDPPAHLVPITLKTQEELRLIEWTVYPEWSSSINIGHVFIQLQLHQTGLPITSLSQLTQIGATGKVTISINQNVLIPANSSLMCAIYSPSAIKGIFQELYVSELS